MTVAFLDHHLDNWHAKVFLKLLRERGHDVVAYESDPLATGDWCVAQGVLRAPSAHEAVARAEAVMLLAPDDLAAHLTLAEAAISSGKPLWIDKLLAPSYEEAEWIVRACEAHGTPLTSGSSLRHAVELEKALESLFPSKPDPQSSMPTEAFFTGYGAWDRYGVHTVAMALRSMGGGVIRLLSAGTDAMRNVTLEWHDGRRAVLIVAEGEGASAAFPWRFALRRDGGYVHETVTDFDGFYVRQLEAILRDFESRAAHDPREMLDTARILELVPRVCDAGWVDL